MSPSPADVSYYFGEETFTVEVAVGEKQISVDPISLKEPTRRLNMEHNLPVPPGAKSTRSFLSFSLPNSASSSPKEQKKKSKNDHQGRRLSPLARQHSVALNNLERLRESHIRRSKSCGEGRACQPSVDYDLWSSCASSTSKSPKSCRPDNNDINHYVKDEEDKIKGSQQVVEVEASYEDKFKCGALCLFLPSFGGGKAKAVRATKEMEPQSGTYADIVVSQRVSLEKFECGSWRSSAVINYEEQFGDSSTSSNLFFDLPVEMIRCSNVNDTESPVTTAFVFDNNNNNKADHQHRKGVLKNTGTATTTTTTTIAQPRKSHDSSNSSRHVRFSTSSPTLCPASPITPRLLKARDDFNAFLEAQSA